MPVGLLPIIYLAFISLGLPDSAIGSAWPTMAPALGAGTSWVGVITIIITAGTIVSSLMSVRVVERFGTGKVTVASVFLTALALVGFSLSREFWQLCALAVPYGLGAGAVDAALNAYVALHYKSQHMSWLHCMWGVGASGGPMIMAACINGGSWNDGFLVLGALQVAIAVVLTVSLPLWKEKRVLHRVSRKASAPARGEVPEASPEGAPVDTGAPAGAVAPAAASAGSASPARRTRRELLRVPGVIAVLICFFCYNALESTCGQWAATYCVQARGIDAATAASWASLFYMGITLGRAVSGFITMKLRDRDMIRLGQVLAAAGIVLVLVPAGNATLLPGLVLIGLGCAPIYPSVIHATPGRFGDDVALELTGMQMAFAYIGPLALSPFFGVLAQYVGAWLYPLYLAVLLVVMVAAAEKLNRTLGARA